jgi:formylglycine-generating enzyme required for sulfatase activity
LNQRYQCDRTLGQGGFGRTHLVRDSQRGDTKVVVKQFIPSEDVRKNASSRQKALQLFHDESARLLQLDQHPQIPILFEAFEEHNSHFLVQQFIDGQTLAEELKAQGKPFTEAQVRSLLLDLLPVLQFIHSHNVIHRDIKPDNIMRRQVDDRMVLIDFGAAKMATQTELAKTGTKIGSAGYAAPEQAYGKATFASDLYSLGVVCLNLLTQMHPFDLYDGMEGGFAWRDFLKNNSVGDSVAGVLDKLTERLLKYRYRSPQDALNDLQQSTPKNYTERLEYTTGWLRKKVSTTFLEMVHIPGGTFMMGAPDNGPETYSDEKPQHRVAVPEFWMGKFPITQAQYQAIMGKNPSEFKGDNRPVEQVSWHDAVEFCQKLSAQTGKQYRLPSEAEWEYACRAGTTTPFHFGQTITTDLANYCGQDREINGRKYPGNYGAGPKGIYREQTTEVGSFPANAFGLKDMHGHVWEWCSDYWHDNYNGAPSDGSAWITGGDDSRRMLRGGSWDLNPRYCRSAIRNRDNPDLGYSLNGFRVVVSSAWTPGSL